MSDTCRTANELTGPSPSEGFLVGEPFSLRPEHLLYDVAPHSMSPHGLRDVAADGLDVGTGV